MSDLKVQVIFLRNLAANAWAHVLYGEICFGWEVQSKSTRKRCFRCNFGYRFEHLQIVFLQLFGKPRWSMKIQDVGSVADQSHHMVLRVISSWWKKSWTGWHEGYPPVARLVQLRIASPPGQGYLMKVEDWEDKGGRERSCEQAHQTIQKT